MPVKPDNQNQNSGTLANSVVLDGRLFDNPLPKVSNSELTSGSRYLTTLQCIRCIQFLVLGHGHSMDEECWSYVQEMFFRK